LLTVTTGIDALARTSGNWLSCLGVQVLDQDERQNDAGRKVPRFRS